MFLYNACIYNNIELILKYIKILYLVYYLNLEQHIIYFYLVLITIAQDK